MWCKRRNSPSKMAAAAPEHKNRRRLAPSHQVPARHSGPLLPGPLLREGCTPGKQLQHLAHHQGAPWALPTALPSENSWARACPVAPNSEARGLRERSGSALTDWGCRSDGSPASPCSEAGPDGSGKEGRGPPYQNDWHQAPVRSPHPGRTHHPHSSAPGRGEQSSHQWPPSTSGQRSGRGAGSPLGGCPGGSRPSAVHARPSACPAGTRVPATFGAIPAAALQRCHVVHALDVHRASRLQTCPRGSPLPGRDTGTLWSSQPVTRACDARRPRRRRAGCFSVRPPSERSWCVHTTRPPAPLLSSSQQLSPALQGPSVLGLAGIFSVQRAIRIEGVAESHSPNFLGTGRGRASSHVNACTGFPIPHSARAQSLYV
ncbi:uncharacterized protein LOC123018781 [Varanus komodoensis]|uniref:uncharacterized protein LOC123018781 n=1 Tax=Varanus komodoensis TaxID=61221 RepID=UPI001CF7CD49|nr:uncharacterized protein LOC123018781 [Varanus komodoensis]